MNELIRVVSVSAFLLSGGFLMIDGMFARFWKEKRGKRAYLVTQCSFPLALGLALMLGFIRIH